MKVCPKCRMINPDGADACSGCGADLGGVATKPGGPHVSMFGSSPRQSGAKPLPKADSQASISSSYGAVKAASEGHSSQVESKKKGFSFGSKKVQPKKPWEK